MGTEVDFAVRQPFESGRVLQLPVLTTGLDIATGQTPAPVTFIQRAVETERQFQFRSLQVEGQLLILMSPWPLAVKVPSDVSPVWMPLPLRSIFARWALSRWHPD